MIYIVIVIACVVSYFLGAWSMLTAVKDELGIKGDVKDVKERVRRCLGVD